MAKIEVYRADNGKKVWVPEHWMDDSELKKPFRKTPQTKAAEASNSSESADSGSSTTTTTASRGSNKPKE
jgi:hypothetical protein